MEIIGYVLVGLGILAIAYGLLASRRRPQVPAVTPAPESDAVLTDIDARVRPTVADFHVKGEEARVTFDVPLPAGGADDVLASLLEYEAVEVLRDKSRSLPIDQVKKVSAFAGRPTATLVGTVELPKVGVLPPEMEPPVELALDRGDDPLTHRLGEHVDASAAGAPASDELPPLASELRIPQALDSALRGIGIDVATADAPELVRGLVTLHRYTVNDKTDNTYIANKGGISSYVYNVAHAGGAHPELDETDIRSFVAGFAGSGADRAMLVTAKYAPYAIYERERLDRRVQFISRERLQAFIDRMATS